MTKDGAHWVQPILAHGWKHPIWFYRYGLEMELLAESNTKEGRILIGGAAGTLDIQLATTVEDGARSWNVKWRTEGFQSCGQRSFSDRDLEAAFGLTDYIESSPDSRWIREVYKGNSIVSGKFFRWEEYLNIPSPGTGRAGDPNLSIQITPGMRRAVQELLKLETTTPAVARA